MTWEIVIGLIALVGFVVSIGKIVSNNTKALTEVKCSIDSLKEAFSEEKTKVDVIGDEVNDHELRITILEHK
jgi:cell division protein FtsL